MRLRVWGTRGSVPAPGPDTVRYGGNTSCLELVMSDEESLVLDAGTGLRRLGLAMRRRPPRRVNILLTHVHLDHVQGLGFFEPLFRQDVDVHIWGPASPTRGIAEQVSRYLGPPLHPVHMDDIPAITFHDVSPGPFQVGSVTVEAHPIVHPGPTVGYRLS